MAQQLLPLDSGPFKTAVVSPFLELGAFERLWQDRVSSFKQLAELIRQSPGALLSALVPRDLAIESANEALARLERAGVSSFGIRIHQAGEYPLRIRDAADPLEFLYFQGNWELVESPCISLVGARKATPDGIARTRRLAKLLVEKGWTIVSGLAAGVDTAAHTAALEAGGRSIAVLGTPLTHSYPKSNRELQAYMGEGQLVLSQVPINRYEKHGPRFNRQFFPERNKTMSAITVATVIVEASDTSGSLTQARAALQQGRRLFILNSCFENSDITWPARFEAQGAVRVRQLHDVVDALAP